MGANMLVDDGSGRARERCRQALSCRRSCPVLYGDGHASERIAAGAGRYDPRADDEARTSQSSGPATSASRSLGRSRTRASASCSSMSTRTASRSSTAARATSRTSRRKRLRRSWTDGLIRATTDYDDLREADAILVRAANATFSPSRARPEGSASRRRRRSPGLRAGALVVLESTTYPGRRASRYCRCSRTGSGSGRR